MKGFAQFDAAKNQHFFCLKKNQVSIQVAIKCLPGTNVIRTKVHLPSTYFDMYRD